MNEFMYRILNYIHSPQEFLWNATQIMNKMST